MSPKFIAGFIVVILISSVFLHFFKRPIVLRPTVQTVSSSTPVVIRSLIATTTYACNFKKTIAATFYEGSVDLVLNNAATTTSLVQTISADGGRYANPDESFVFWDKGKGAMVLENGVEKNYLGCVSTK